MQAWFDKKNITHILCRKFLFNCGEKQCEACKEFYISDDYRCFIKKLENTEKHDGPQYWVYNFESRVVNTEHASVHKADAVDAMKLYGDEQETFKNN